MHRARGRCGPGPQPPSQAKMISQCCVPGLHRPRLSRRLRLPHPPAQRPSASVVLSHGSWPEPADSLHHTTSVSSILLWLLQLTLRFHWHIWTPDRLHRCPAQTFCRRGLSIQTRFARTVLGERRCLHAALAARFQCCTTQSWRVTVDSHAVRMAGKQRPRRELTKRVCVILCWLLTSEPALARALP